MEKYSEQPKTMGVPWHHKWSLVESSEDPWVQEYSWGSTSIDLTSFPHGNKTSVMLTAKPNTVDQGSLQP